LTDHSINDRKIEHLDIVVSKDVDHPSRCEEIYSSVVLVHQGFPRISYGDVDLSIDFLGYHLDAPIMITGITGGHPDTRIINEKIASIVEKLNIAMGLGSQRPMLIYRDREDVVETYRVARRILKNQPLIGNIGINTLNDLKPSDIEYIVKTVELDALAIHLNPAQEIIQPEGDTRFNKELVSKVEEILDYIDIPVLIKEVGMGLSKEVVSIFYSIGIRIFDVAGACGTNWALVEKYRGRTSVDKKVIADLLKNWGIPTPLSVIESRASAPKSFIIASGGVWDGVKAVKNIVLGADMVGLAKPIVVNLTMGGLEQTLLYLNNYIQTMKTIFFLIGAGNIREARGKPVILYEPIPTYLSQREIDIKQYISVTRMGV